MRRILVGLSVGLLTGASVAQIPMSGYVKTFTDTLTRGYFFQTPIDIQVTELQVPDELHIGKYMVALYKLAAAPPAFGTTVVVTPVFYAGSVKSNTCVKIPTTAGSFKKGDWIAVLGACGEEIGGMVRNSYGAKLGTGNQSAILGMPIATGLQRCGMQLNIGPKKGVGPIWGEPKGAIGRVKMTIKAPGASGTTGAGSCDFCAPSAGNASLDVYATHPSIIGKEVKLEMRANGIANAGGLMAYGILRANVVLPGFGRLCVFGIQGIVPFGAGPIPSSATGKILSVGTLPTATPVGVKIVFQGVLITANPPLRLTNGLEVVAGR